jgi:hypothetical protein
MLGGRLKIRLAGASRVASTAGQVATRTVTSVEFQVIGACGNRPDDDRESAIAVNVGRDDAKLYPYGSFGHTLPCNRSAGTTTAIGRKLTESLRKRGAEDVNTDLVELTGRRVHRFIGHRQLARRRRDGPRDVAVREVKQFAEIVPTCGPFLCRQSLRNLNEQAEKDGRDTLRFAVRALRVFASDNLIRLFSIVKARKFSVSLALVLARLPFPEQ